MFHPILRSRRVRAPLALGLSLSLVASSMAGGALAQTPMPPAASAPAAAPPSAAASPSAPPAPLSESLQGMARAEYAAARILYEDGDYAGALTKLQAAYEASKDPRLLWNMAACEKEQRHYVSVLELLERYAREGAHLITEEERAATAGLVSTVQAFVNELTLSVQPDGATVLVDGVALGTSPLAEPLRLDMGKRRLRVEKEGFVAHESELDLAGGKRAALEIALVPELHEGTLRITTDPNAVISVDGRVVGTATWSGKLPSGTHSVHVSAPGKRPHQTEVVIKDDDTSSVMVNLVADTPQTLLTPEKTGIGTVWWIVGGVALAGVGLSTYLLLRPGESPSQPPAGSWGLFEL